MMRSHRIGAPHEAMLEHDPELIPDHAPTICFLRIILSGWHIASGAPNRE